MLLFEHQTEVINKAQHQNELIKCYYLNIRQKLLTKHNIKEKQNT